MVYYSGSAQFHHNTKYPQRWVFVLFCFFLVSVHVPNSAITESGKVGVAIENNGKRLFEKEE